MDIDRRQLFLTDPSRELINLPIDIERELLAALFRLHIQFHGRLARGRIIACCRPPMGDQG